MVMDEMMEDGGWRMEDGWSDDGDVDGPRQLTRARVVQAPTNYGTPMPARSTQPGGTVESYI
eukprot:3249634-Rhodomonas_salina.1